MSVTELGTHTTSSSPSSYVTPPPSLPLSLPPPPDIITLSGRCYTGEWADADADALPRFPISSSSSSFTPTNPAGAVVRSLAPSCFLPADLIMFPLPSFLLLLRFHPLLQIISAHMTVTSGVRVETRDLTPASPLHISPSSLTHTLTRERNEGEGSLVIIGPPPTRCLSSDLEGLFRKKYPPPPLLSMKPYGGPLTLRQ